jgi:hypothetical protein
LPTNTSKMPAGLVAAWYCFCQEPDSWVRKEINFQKKLLA